MRKSCLFVPCFQDLVLKHRIKEKIAQIKEKHNLSDLPESHEIDHLLQTFNDHGLNTLHTEQQQKTLR